jgi:acyl carrier protein
MDDAEILNRLNGAFRTVFGDHELALSRDTTAEDVEGWDSLMHINLIVAIEKEFKVRFTTREITVLRNVGDLMNLLARKSAASS